MERSSTFIGSDSFFLIGVDNYAFWFYQFAFAATSTTIVAGTLAERSQMVSYFLYSIVLSGFVFPVIAHSVWSVEGFLNADKANRLFGSGMVDFAGSGVVHVTGGLTALIASKILGPRKDRFHDDLGNPLHTPNHIQKYSVSLQVLGTFLLWFGWYGFNVGSVKFISTESYASVAALSALTTTLGGASGSITALGAFAFWTQRQTGETKFDISYALNGCLSGLVAITGGCAVIEPWAALLVGSAAGIIYVLASNLLIHLRIDDAVDAIPVHLFNGVWGVIAVGLFASPSRMEIVYQRSDHVGWFYSWGRNSSDATLLGANVVGLLFIAGFVTFIMLPFFFTLLYLGWFRSDPIEEIVGLDRHYRGNVDSEICIGTIGKTHGQHLHAENQKLKKRYHFESDQEAAVDEDENEDDIEQQVEETVDTSDTP
jgi:Amt family ammonium transporter